MSEQVDTSPIRQLIAEREKERDRIQWYIDGLWLAIRIMEGTDTPIERRSYTAEAAIARIDEARTSARSEGDEK